MSFEFATATRIIFGRGTLAQAAPAAASLGKRALVVTGRSLERATPLLDDLRTAGLSIHTIQVQGEPAVDFALQGAESARSQNCDLVVGMGGGSVIDAAKAMAALLTNPGDVYDYLEVVGRSLPLTHPPAPCIAIPTTAGTGSEVTRNAVLAATREGVKVSLRSPLMLPRLAIVDPALTLALPPDLTATTGLDALTQVIEPFLCNAPNPLTDAICREAMGRGARSLLRAVTDGDDPAAREDMCIVSLFGGMALANARLGAVHGLAGPIGGMFPDAHHGAICARLLPAVLKRNLSALRERTPLAASVLRFAEVARILTGHPQAEPEDGLEWLQDLVSTLPVPPLSAAGVTSRDFDRIILQSRKSSSMKGNPIELTDDELQQILATAV